jgi:hypothetical protein
MINGETHYHNFSPLNRKIYIQKPLMNFCWNFPWKDMSTFPLDYPVPKDIPQGRSPKGRWWTTIQDGIFGAFLKVGVPPLLSKIMCIWNGMYMLIYVYIYICLCKYILHECTWHMRYGCFLSHGGNPPVPSHWSVLGWEPRIHKSWPLLSGGYPRSFLNYYEKYVFPYCIRHVYPYSLVKSY